MASKIASIRKRQLGEKSYYINESKEIGEKQELEMELERLKGIERVFEAKKKTDEQNKFGREIIIEQIKYRELEKQRKRDDLLKEREEINIKMKKMNEEHDLKERKSREFGAKVGLEIFEANKQFKIHKDKKKKDDQELDRKIHEYNKNKYKKEDEDLAEKQRLAELKENEMIQLRRKQERSLDRKADLDMLRAKRANETKEREERQRVKEETMHAIQTKQNMILANQQQKKDKLHYIEEEAKKVKEEFELIIRNLLKVEEIENKKVEERKIINSDHNRELR